MNKLLVVCGPTATGKTELALWLAKKFGGELVSADSRQVYRGMDIGTGKDILPDSGFRISDFGFKDFEIGYYTDGKIRIWGYDLVEPTEEFSVGQYVQIARKIINDIWKRRKLPILVGGTGLYIQGIVDGIGTSSIPRDKNLRKSLEGKSKGELFEILTRTDPVKAASLNISDKKNPRRLVRAIEIVKSRAKGQRPKVKTKDILFVGLKTKKQELDKKIENRVEKRIKEGFKEELKELLENGVTWNMQSMSSLGYKQFKDYVLGKEGKDSTIRGWKQAEKQYAKRQTTWFKRDKRISWFDISEEKWQEKIEKLVNKWYKVG